MANAEAIAVICHGPGAWRLQLRPRGLRQLQQLLDANSFWAQGRNPKSLKQMLHRSQAAVCAWEKGELVGFGRATSDGLFRAVLWDVVVAESHQGQGLGRRMVENLVQTPALKRVERIYLMTTNSAGFYGQLGFQTVDNQRLMLLNGSKTPIKPS